MNHWNTVKFIVILTYITIAYTSNIVHQLDGVLNEILSPGYPNSYPSDQNVTWHFRVRPGYKIALTFTQFDLEDSYEEGKGSCVYDYVEVIEDGKAFFKFCHRGNSSNGPVLNRAIHSSGHLLTLRFVSDYSNEDPKPKGFRAYSAEIDRDECKEKEIELYFAYDDWDQIIYCNHHCHNVPGSYSCSCDEGFHLHTNKHTCTSDCQGVVMSNDTGIISTSKYPISYSKLANCDWTIKGKVGISIDFRFTENFNVEEHYDEGCVYDWVQYEYSNLKSQKYCGKTSPQDGGWIRTDAPVVKVTFITDLTEEKAGFQIEYKFKRVRCGTLTGNLDNGKIVLSNDRGYHEFEDVIRFNCNEGYRIVGNKFITCQNNGKWSGQIPQCEVVICDKPIHLDNIKNGRIKDETVSLSYGSTLSVWCFEWFELTSGSADWKCGNEGLWIPNSEVVAPNNNNNMPVCDPICGLKGNKFVLADEYDLGNTVKPGMRLASKGFSVSLLVINRVGGAKKAKNGEWPWMVFVDMFGRGLDTNEFCGGTLVSMKTVVTAAHCVTVTYKSAIKVYVGASERDNPGDSAIQTFGVAEMYTHENFTDDFDNDIAVLILDAPVKIGKFARPVCLPRSNREQSLHLLGLSDTANYQKTGIIAGWGVTDKGTLSYQLLMGRVPAIDYKKCVKHYERTKSAHHEGVYITDNMICAGYFEGGKDTCKGDSGGPFMYKDPTQNRYFLIGIVSFGSSDRKCGDKTFGIYTKVSKYISWIENFLVE